MEVLVLTQEDCDLCERARELLASLSEEYPLSIRALELGTARGRELAASGGFLFPPGVFVDGVPFSYGRLSERKLRRELDQRLVRP
ncbi:MAG: glutaredoxin family protein [Thermoleophilaceae bacterium]